jgi:2-keto-4-pentenoate hydratase/2-oxohepta-3-ene-1,7-dioic acid hydratase in catechol pathway
MLIARFSYEGREAYGVVDGEEVRPVDGDIFGDYHLSPDAVPLAQIHLLAPLRPSKILAVAFNYRSHLGETSPPANPELFLKPPSAVIGPGEAIVLPPGAGRVDYEGELVAVVGRPCRDVGEGEALDYILGYTCGNDVSARPWQKGDRQWWRAKGCDTFAPLGPWIATGLDPANLELRTSLNGQLHQSTNTALLIHNVARLVSFASSTMTLEPGDLIFTGTPGETRRLSPGDVVEVEIQGIGALRNPVRAARASG